MSVARTSISLPLQFHRDFLNMVKERKTTMSKMVLNWIKEEKRKKRNEKLTAEFNAVIAKDPSYNREAEEFATMVSRNYAKNILPYND